MAASWRPVSISSTHLPPLMISTVFSQDSYIIHMTDLTRLWTESLNRKAIVQRSLNECTIIDGSQDAEQLALLLRNIEGAIRGTNDSILTIKHDDSSSEDALILQIRVNLPEDLPPLEWPVQLSLRDSFSFTNMFTLPLLAAQHARTKELESLVDVVRDKDHVIQKLVDKLEASGADWGQIFPNAAVKGAKKTTKTQASSKVKGLTAFDNEQWWRDRAKDRVTADVKTLAVQAFCAHGLEIRYDDHDGLVPEKYKMWWKGLVQTSTNTKLPSSSSSEGCRKAEREDDSNDFQVQSTPIGYSRSSNKKSSRPSDDSTKDEGLGATSQISVVPDSFPLHDMVSPSPSFDLKGKKLGVTGKAKRFDGSSVPQAMSNEMPDSPPSPPRPKPKAETPSKPRKGVLGKIGGRKRALTPSPQFPVPVAADAEIKQEKVASPVSSRKKAPKLGLIGQKAHESPVVMEEPKDRSLGTREHEALPREKSEDQALGRSEEIQTEPEDRAAIIKKPVKKRRKF